MAVAVAVVRTAMVVVRHLELLAAVAVTVGMVIQLPQQAELVVLQIVAAAVAVRRTTVNLVGRASVVQVAQVLLFCAIPVHKKVLAVL
jgi:hypothetical protein